MGHIYVLCGVISFLLFTLKLTNMSDFQQKALNHLGLDSTNPNFSITDSDIYDLSNIQAGYDICQKEYEEKLRWIIVEEKLPEDCPELFLKKCMTKNVLVKRKWNDTGEIVIEINSRFSPSERIGFLWNYDYKDSEVIEWRSFL